MKCVAMLLLTLLGMPGRPIAARSQASEDPEANPGRPTVLTPATLTPGGYLTLKRGFAGVSAQSPATAAFQGKRAANLAPPAKEPAKEKDQVDKEPAAILELGGAGNWNVKGDGSSFGPTVAVELAPKKWLELEAGVTPLFARHSTERDVDLLFKKPWEISEKVDFMLGVGPVWVHTNKSDMTRNSISGEIAPDFMFWPSARRRFGWYIEPSYEYNFGPGHEQSIGVTVGLLIAIR